MLILPIKKKWFDMILSGEKKEEYRLVKPYWTKRFEKVFGMYAGIPTDHTQRPIVFKNGYRPDSPSFIAYCSLSVNAGRMKEEWGYEPGYDYYVLTIHDIMKTENVGGR